MLQLKCQENGRLFTIYDDNYQVLKKILSIDLTSSANNILCQAHCLCHSDIQLILNTITNLTSNNKLYEFQNGDRIEVIANPTKDQIANTSINIVPLHAKRVNFLTSLSNFLRSSEWIDIT